MTRWHPQLLNSRLMWRWRQSSRANQGRRRKGKKKRRLKKVALEIWLLQATFFGKTPKFMYKRRRFSMLTDAIPHGDRKRHKAPFLLEVAGQILFRGWINEQLAMTTWVNSTFQVFLASQDFNFKESAPDYRTYCKDITKVSINMELKRSSI
ncbi:hypothetical protein Tco_1092727 [Tanacetum coccineum]|uniref:Uncharacterized protein n=1 Tax=Tanacetum coccineum TaxID=301880 RepID=A0ABQ5IAN8_9ASTR